MHSYKPPSQRPRPSISSTPPATTTSTATSTTSKSDRRKMAFKQRFWTFSSANDFAPEASTHAPPPTEAKRAPYVPQHAASDFLQVSMPSSSRVPSRRPSHGDRSISSRSASTRSSLHQQPVTPLECEHDGFVGSSVGETEEEEEGGGGGAQHAEDYGAFMKEAEEEHARDLAWQRKAFHAALQRATINEGRKGGGLREYVKPTSALY